MSERVTLFRCGVCGHLQDDGGFGCLNCRNDDYSRGEVREFVPADLARELYEALRRAEAVDSRDHGLINDALASYERHGLSGAADPEARDPRDPSRPVPSCGEGSGLTSPEASGGSAEPVAEREAGE